MTATRTNPPMTVQVAHPRVATVANAIRAHALVWLLAAAVLITSANTLVAGLSSHGGGAATSRPPSVSPSSVTGDFVYPPAERTGPIKYLYP